MGEAINKGLTPETTHLVTPFKPHSRLAVDEAITGHAPLSDGPAACVRTVLEAEEEATDEHEN